MKKLTSMILFMTMVLSSFCTCINAHAAKVKLDDGNMYVTSVKSVKISGDKVTIKGTVYSNGKSYKVNSSFVLYKCRCYRDICTYFL